MGLRTVCNVASFLRMVKLNFSGAPASATDVNHHTMADCRLHQALDGGWWWSAACMQFYYLNQSISGHRRQFKLPFMEEGSRKEKIEIKSWSNMRKIIFCHRHTPLMQLFYKKTGKKIANCTIKKHFFHTAAQCIGDSIN